MLWDSFTLGLGATLGYIAAPLVIGAVCLIVGVPLLLVYSSLEEHGWVGEGRRARAELCAKLSNEWQQWGRVVECGANSRERLRRSILRRWIVNGRVEQISQDGYPVVHWAQH